MMKNDRETKRTRGEKRKKEEGRKEVPWNGASAPI